jgi:hypothetical protein
MPCMDQGLALRAEDARDAMTVAFADEDQERAIVHEQKRPTHCDKYTAGRPRNVRCRLRPLWSDSGTRVANQIPCSAKNVVGARIREYGPCEVPSRAAHVCRGEWAMIVSHSGRSSRRPSREDGLATGVRGGLGAVVARGAPGPLNAIHRDRGRPAARGVSFPRHGTSCDERGGCGRARGGGRGRTEVSFDVRQSCGNEWRADSRVAMRVLRWN